MVLNVNEIIENKIKELESNHVIENAIQKKVESVVIGAVDSAFNWEFSRVISEEIKKQVGNIAASVKLNSYNTLIADTVRNITEMELNKDLAEKVQTKLHALMLVTEKSVKFTDIVKSFRECCCDDDCDDDCEYSYEVSETERECYGSLYKGFVFTPSGNDFYKLRIELSEHDGVWTIFRVDFDGETIYFNDKISVLKNYSSFECLVLKALLNRLPIELDCSTADCEEILCNYLE